MERGSGTGPYLKLRDSSAAYDGPPQPPPSDGSAGAKDAKHSRAHDLAGAKVRGATPPRQVGDLVVTNKRQALLEFFLPRPSLSQHYLDDRRDFERVATDGSRDLTDLRGRNVLVGTSLARWMDCGTVGGKRVVAVISDKPPGRGTPHSRGYRELLPVSGLVKDAATQIRTHLCDGRPGGAFYWTFHLERLADLWVDTRVDSSDDLSNVSDVDLDAIRFDDLAGYMRPAFLKQRVPTPEDAKGWQSLQTGQIVRLVDRRAGSGRMVGNAVAMVVAQDPDHDPPRIGFFMPRRKNASGVPVSDALLTGLATETIGPGDLQAAAIAATNVTDVDVQMPSALLRQEWFRGSREVGSEDDTSPARVTEVLGISRPNRGPRGSARRGDLYWIEVNQLLGVPRVTTVVQATMPAAGAGDDAVMDSTIVAATPTDMTKAGSTVAADAKAFVPPTVTPSKLPPDTAAAATPACS